MYPGPHGASSPRRTLNVQLRTKTIRDISRYEQDGQGIWAADIPRELGCHCIVWRRATPEASGDDVSDEVWIEVRTVIDIKFSTSSG